MEINNILISSGITSALYGLYKGGTHIYKNYYLKSECHNQTLEITIVNHHTESPPIEVIPPPESLV